MMTTLQEMIGSLSSFLPEASLALVFFALLLLGLIRVPPKALPIATITGFTVSLLFLLMEGVNESAELFGGMLRTDGISRFIRILIDTAGLLTCAIFATDKYRHQSEHLALLVAIAWGAHLLTLSTNFLMIFLSIEIISIGSFVLTGFRFNKSGIEGAMKYFVFGVAASATMLYGFSFFYGLTGQIDFAVNGFFDEALRQTGPMLTIASVLVLAGFLYKIAAVPMHLWAPDAYQAAPLPVVAFFSIVPKLAGLTVLLKFVLAMNLLAEDDHWQVLIAGLAILSITLGNVGALTQKDVKRMMAYSSIAHAGFMMAAIACFTPSGIQFFLFYAVVYLVSNFAVFAFLGDFSEDSLENVARYSGFGRAHPVPMAGVLTGMISLTGLPPTAGFMAKFFLFSALWQSYEVSSSTALLVLIVAGLVNTAIALFYYLRLPYFAYLKTVDSVENQNIRPRINLFGLVLVLVVIALFFLPSLLMGWINKINFVL